MEEGSFRCDANISLRPRGQKEFGTRTELKNLNSFKHVEKAIVYEIQRQTYVLEEGKSIVQETRLWDPAKNRTAAMRGKEEAHDYRYFPDPDLVPLMVDDDWISRIQKTMPELPDEKRSRFVREYSLADNDAGILTSSIDLADFFEATLVGLSDKRQAANWTMTVLLGMLNTRGIPVSESPVKPENFSKLLKLMEDGKINASAGKIIFEEMADTSKDPALIVKEKGLEQVSDLSELEAIVQEIIQENPHEAAAFRDGKKKLFSFFMGRVMKKTQGKADPKVVTRLLNTKL
jgi:aspartyl-tRNA(Asn)/glutamyl-tRNA(Gln) amidotransferase subunit B